MPRRVPSKPQNTSTRPTTKAKQRAFLDALIQGIVLNSINRVMTIQLLRALRRELRNRRPVKRAPQTADPMSPQKRAVVLRMFRQNPNMTNQDIANRLNLNGGRVSEILAGKRT